MNIRAGPPSWHREQALGDPRYFFWSRNGVERHFGCVHARRDGVYADRDAFESDLSREHFCKMGRSCFGAVICELARVNKGHLRRYPRRYAHMSLRNLQDPTYTGNVDNARCVTFDIPTTLVE